MTIEKATPAMIRQVLFETDWPRARARSDAATEAAAAPDIASAPGEAAPFARRVQALRTQLDLTQAGFATRFGLSPALVRDWEHAHAEPGDAARALLQVIEQDPDAVVRALARSP